MTIVRWDAFRDMAAREEQLSRMLAGLLRAVLRKTSPAARGCRRSTFTATASTSWC